MKKIFYNILIFVALAFIIAGVVLFFRGSFYSIPALLGGFLLLSMYTVSLLDFKKERLKSFLQLLTVLLFLIVTFSYVLAYPKYYILLWVAIFFQFFITMWSLWRK